MKRKFSKKRLFNIVKILCILWLIIFILPFIINLIRLLDNNWLFNECPTEKLTQEQIESRLELSSTLFPEMYERVNEDCIGTQEVVILAPIIGITPLLLLYLLKFGIPLTFNYLFPVSKNE